MLSICWHCAIMVLLTLFQYGATSRTVEYQAGDEHIATVIWLHGLGDTGEGFWDAREHFTERLPGVKFLFPTAPMRPITVLGGEERTAWFDITSTFEHMDPEQIPEGIETSKEMVWDLIRQERFLGIPMDRIFVGGFSQGAVLAYYSGLDISHIGPTGEDGVADPDTTLGGVFAASGFLPAPAHIFSGSMTKFPPVVITHGKQDQLIPPIAAKQAKLTLKSHDIKVYSKITQTLKHTLGLDHIVLINTFLQKALPGEDEATERYAAEHSVRHHRQQGMRRQHYGKVDL